MKKIYTLLAAGLFGIATLSAQNEGYRVPKSVKWWKAKPGISVQLYTVSGPDIKGPKAKNATPTQRRQGELVAVNTNANERLKGPKAKNKKH